MNTARLFVNSGVTNDDRETIDIMSSGRGSVSNNDNGHHERYRDGKAALNRFMRSFAARQGDDPRTVLLMSPGWVQTEMGHPHAASGEGQAFRVMRMP